jgi:hypothetical protein
MPIPSNLYLATLIIEKLNHSGVSFLKGIGRMNETEATDKLGSLQHDHRHFYNEITRDYILGNINDIVYQLSLEKDHILGVGLYKELLHTSLQEAYEHQKDLMAKLGTRRIDPNNIWQKMKNDAAGTSLTSGHITGTAIAMDYQQKPPKRYVLIYIILAAVIGFFYYLWDEAHYRHDLAKQSRYFLFLTFSIMALVALFIYSAYQRSVIRRINRGEKIEKG